jgi:hypothetical protein
MQTAPPEINKGAVAGTIPPIIFFCLLQQEKSFLRRSLGCGGDAEAPATPQSTRHRRI